MRKDYTALAFVQLLRARVGNCSSIEQGDRIVPTNHDSAKKVWVVFKGTDAMRSESLFQDDDNAKAPFRLVHGGSIGLYVRIREKADRTIAIVTYRIDIRLPQNVNGITSLRFENDQSGRGGSGWDDDLQDNPEHPLNHLHINYLQATGANTCVSLLVKSARLCFCAPLTIGTGLPSVRTHSGAFGVMLNCFGTNNPA